MAFVFTHHDERPFAEETFFCLIFFYEWLELSECITRKHWHVCSPLQHKRITDPEDNPFTGQNLGMISEIFVSFHFQVLGEIIRAKMIYFDFLKKWVISKLRKPKNI